jgi:hypothetical protein
VAQKRMTIEISNGNQHLDGYGLLTAGIFKAGYLRTYALILWISPGTRFEWFQYELFS